MLFQLSQPDAPVLSLEDCSGSHSETEAAAIIQGRENGSLARPSWGLGAVVREGTGVSDRLDGVNLLDPLCWAIGFKALSKTPASCNSTVQRDLEIISHLGKLHPREGILLAHPTMKEEQRRDINI